MVYLLGGLQFLIIASTVLFEYKNGSLSVFLWATLMIMFSLPHSLSLIINTNVFSNSVLNEASMFVILFTLLYLLLRYIYIKLLNSKRTINFKNINKEIIYYYNNDASSRRFVLICFILLTISILIYIFYSYRYLGGILSSSWGGFRNINLQLGAFSLIRYAGFLFSAVSGIALIHLILGQNKLYLISIVILLLFPVITGSRSDLLPTLVMIITYLIYNKKLKLNLKNLIILSLIGFISIYTIYFLRILRFQGDLLTVLQTSSLGELNTKTLDSLLNGESELGLRNYFYYFIENNNNFPNFGKGHTYLRLLLMFVPTFIMPDLKPPDFAISMGQAVSGNYGNTLFSMHPTFFGDIYANFAFFGILFSIILVLFTITVDNIADRKNPIIRNLLIILYANMYVLIGRGSVYNAVFSATLSTFILIICNYLSRIVVTKTGPIKVGYKNE